MMLTGSCLLKASVLLAIQIFCSALCFGQGYPNWFLSPSHVECEKIAIGFANSSFFPDSAASYAIRNGYESFARQKRTEISGGQAFWSTEFGMLWMGSNFTERFDSTAIDHAASILVPRDTLVTKDFVAVLLALPDCALEDDYRKHQSRKGLPLPSWIETSPQDSLYYYAVGLAPEYYYETSSWREAEVLARRNLARVVHTKMQALQKVGVQGQEILNEELSVVLRNSEIVSRWRDQEEKFFYVLIRMPKY